MEFVSKLLGLCCNGSDRLGGEQISLEGVSAITRVSAPALGGRNIGRRTAPSSCRSLIGRLDAVWRSKKTEGEALPTRRI